MDQATKAAPAVHAGPSPGANGVLNGSANGAAPMPSRKKSAFYGLLITVADLRITVVLFALALLIVFWGTLAQVDYSVWNVQTRYFRSWVAFIPLRVMLFNLIETSPFNVPFPGGLTIGAVMLVNLLAAHAVRFKLTWNRAGIIVIHAGIIIMMLSEVITYMYAEEGTVQIKVGRSAQAIMHPHSAEFAVIRTVGDKQDEVVTVPRRLLEPGATVDDPRLPFILEVDQYMPNSDLQRAKPSEIPAGAKGNARVYKAVEQKEIAGVSQNQRYEFPSMYARLKSRDGKDLGVRLFSAIIDPEWIAVESNGQTTKYQVTLRFKETQRDFVIHLDKFTHDVYPGTNTPKDFHSYIRITDEKAGIHDRPEEIYMNHPFSYKGETFYQQNWTTDPITRKADGTVLQVVRNPGSALPYISCFLVGIGMLYHFGITLYKFVDRRVVR